jgi:protein-S-isoprenylcysteine O-methyltransferase Ste14
VDPLVSETAWLALTVAMFLLRAPFIGRSTKVPVVRSEISRREKILVSLVLVGMLLLPLLWVLTPLLAFADRPQPLAVLILGIGIAGAGLALLWRTHRDLGRNWSNTLQVREGHALVTGGVYLRVRHPMYAALLLHALGQALVVSSWVAGPAYLATFAALVLGRLGPEERLMAETFGPAWDDYRSRTRRLIPGVW